MRLSIITVNLNNKLGLLLTFDSLNKQTNQNFEHIVIDGNSNDGSLELIKNNERINKYISEDDTGVYDAMNKGIELATGEYLLFLNSGDYLHNSYTLEKVYEDLHSYDILYGDLIFEMDGKFVTHHYPDKITFNYLMNSSLGHPASFIKRSLFHKCGLYNQDFNIIADWVFFIQAIAKHEATFKHLDQIISVFDTDGMSSIPENQESILRQRNKFLQSEFSFFYEDYINFTETQKILNTIKSSKGYKLLKSLRSKKFQY